MEHIKRMESEAFELSNKIEKARLFLESEQARLLDRKQIELLQEQLGHMQKYLNILRLRIEYDNIISEETKNI